MELKEIMFVVQDYVLTDGVRFQNAKEKLVGIINDPQVLEIVVKKTDNYGFRKIVKDFGLDELVAVREHYEREILNNFDQYSLETVQQAFCDLLFHKNKQNVKLTIETLKERAKYSKEYNEMYESCSELYEKILAVLEMNKDNYDKEQLVNLLNDISKMNGIVNENGATILDLTDMLFEEASKQFEDELALEISKSEGKMFSGIEPEIIDAPNGKSVKVFKMQNQTENQSEFCLMARTMYAAAFLTEENAMQKYQEEMAKKDYLSYSVIDQSKNGGFGRRDRVMFGFFNFGRGQMMSCNTHDGQTNQCTLHKGKYIFRQEFLPLQDFMKRTGSYNEVVFDNPETILPSVIISPSAEPDEKTIQIASALNIPILYIDESCYEQYPRVERNTDSEWYSYEAFLKEPLCPLQSTESTK